MITQQSVESQDVITQQPMDSKRLSFSTEGDHSKLQVPEMQDGDKQIETNE